MLLYIYNETQLNHKNIEALAICSNMIELESVMLSEIGQTKEQILYDFAHMR